MKCSTCQTDGQQSTIRIGQSFTTQVAINPFYDEAGRLHYHDPNVTTTEFRCSRGHSWTERRQHPCIVCNEPIHEISAGIAS